MKFDWPIAGVGLKPGIAIVQKFGEHNLDYSQFNLKGHNGLDIAAPKSTPVLAVHDGNMEHFQDDNGYGINARVFFDDPENPGQRFEITYGHFEKYEGGARDVKRGEVIGYVDSTGFSTGNHLHFGVRKWNQNGILNYDNGYLGGLDPLTYLKPRAFLVGYHKHPEKDFTFRLDSMGTLQWFEAQQILKDVFYLETDEFTLPMDRPPYPTP